MTVTAPAPKNVSICNLRRAAPGLAAGSVCALRKRTECHKAQADDQDDECNAEGLPVASTDLRWIGNVVHRRYRAQVTQIVKQNLHRCIALLWITANRPHDDRRQGRGQGRIELQNARRIMRDIWGNDGKSVLLLKRRSPTKQLIEHHPDCIDTNAGTPGLAEQPRRSQEVRAANGRRTAAPADV